MPAPEASQTYDLKLGDKEYKEIAVFVHKTAGINLLDGKKELVRTRLAKRVNALNMPSYKAYFDFVMSDRTGQELIFLLDALATNLTSFFREPQHFKFMAQKMLPELEAKLRKTGSRRLRIWSAACSSGEEPYTIGMVASESNPYFAQGNDFKILATDLSTKVLRMAKDGLYGPERVKNIPPAILQKYFTRQDALYKVNSDLARLVVFKRFNLMDPLPFKGPLDLIFCRNVVIYFDKKTIGELIERFYHVLAPGGYLFIGHSESLSGLSHPFKRAAPCVYIKE